MTIFSRMASAVVGIDNIKPLHDASAMVLRNHMQRILDLHPDSQRSFYKPSDEFTITLHGHEVDYINLGDSSLWFKVVFYDPKGFATSTKKVLANGGASFVHRFTNWCGTQELEDIEYYNVHIPSEIEGHLASDYHNDQTLMFADVDSPMYCEGLHMPDATSTHPTTGAGKWSYPVWVQVPIACAYSGAGFIPVFQMANKIKLKFRIADQHEIWRNAHDGSINGPYGEFSAGISYGGGHAAAAAPSPLFYGLVKASWENNNWDFRIEDVVLQAHGLTVLSGGALDANPFDIWTQSTLVLRQNTLGLKNERAVFQIKKSSIERAKFMFLAPSAFTAQTSQASDIGQWYRSSPFNYDNGHQFENNTPGTRKNTFALRYTPWIEWWKVSLGSVSYPTPVGAGNRSPAWVDDNCHIWHNEFLQYFGRNLDTGDVFSPMLRPFNEESHGHFYADAVIPLTDYAQDGTATNTTGAVVGIEGRAAFDATLKRRSIRANASWFGNALALYSARATRVAIIGDVDTSIPHKKAYGLVTLWMPGGKFMACVNFNPVDKVDHLIQGIDTEMFDILFEWTRYEAIQSGATSHPFGCPGVKSIYGRNSMSGVVTDRLGIDPTVNYHYDEITDVFGFITFDIKLTLANGIITIDD